jgi:hypothetical protein
VAPLSQQTFNGLVNLFNTVQANDAASAVNSLNVPTMQQLFPSGFPGDATSGSLLGVPGLSAAAAGNFSMFGPVAPTSDNAVNTFVPRDPTNPSAVGLPQDFATIDAMFPSSVNSFAPPTTSSGIPTFQAALAAGNAAGGAAPTAPGSVGSDSGASSSLPAPSATATGTGLTTGDIAATATDPNAVAAAASAAASTVTDPTQLPTVSQITQFSTSS